MAHPPVTGPEFPGTTPVPQEWLRLRQLLDMSLQDMQLHAPIERQLTPPELGGRPLSDMAPRQSPTPQPRPQSQAPQTDQPFMQFIRMILPVLAGGRGGTL